MSAELLTLRAAAARLSVHWKTVYKLVYAGKIRAIRITGPGPRGPIRIAPEELERYIASRAPVVDEPPASERAALGLEEHHEFT